MNESPVMPIRNRTAFILFSLVGLLLYLNSLNSPFHYDDIYYLKENLGIKSLALFWDRFGGNISALFRGRPILLLTFLINYKLGGLDTLGYHLLNVLIHVSNAFLLYIILRRYLESGTGKGLSNTPLLAAGLFLIHPICTESVTYLSSRSSELSALFVLLSMYCFFRGTEQKIRGAFYLFSVLFFLFGLMTKEAAVVLPALLLLFDYFFISKSMRGLQTRLKYHLPHILVMCALSVVYISMIVAPPAGAVRPWLTHIFTELKVFTQYLRLLTVPVGLNIDHEVIPSGLADSQVVVSILILSALLSAAMIVRKRYPVISFSIFWFFINMVPFLFMRLEDFMAERWIYLAAIGFCIGIADILMTMTRLYRRTGLVATGVVLLLCGTLTVTRNQVYASPVLLWEDAAKKSPEKYRPFVNLSSAYMENGDTAKAIESSQEAIRQWKKKGSNSKDILTAYINLTTAAYGDDPGQAGEVLSAIATEASQNVDYYGTLGSFSMNAGKYQDALASFKKALALSPRSAAFLFLIGECYENTGQKGIAREYFVRATTMIPQTAQEYMGQGEAFSKLGEYQKASDCFHESVRTDPMDVSMRVYFATILQKNQYLDQALEQFSLALKISPGYVPAYKGMGEVMLEKGKYEMAEKYLDRALALLPLRSPERKNVLALMETAKKGALEHTGGTVVR